jgi:hypothetical protein
VQWCGEEIEAEAISVKEKSCVKNWILRLLISTRFSFEKGMLNL